MTLSFECGFLRDDATFVLAVTTDATGAAWQTGFLRSPTGELVVTTDATGATWQTGFLRAPSGALVVEQDGTGEFQSGWVRTSTGALAVTQSVAGAAVGSGFLRTASGVPVMSGLSVSKLAFSGTGATTPVTNTTELASAVAAASTGDTIELADGNYDLTAALVINVDGIRIKAQNEFGAVVRGSATAPTAANVETTPAHTVFGFQVRANDVYIEDIHFKWLGVAVDLDSVDDVVIQNNKIESCFDAGIQNWDCIRPRVHMNQILDPLLAGDTSGTITAAGSVTDAQMDYGCNFFGCQDPSVTHNYFFGIFNQACSFKEGNQNSYAGYNTFEGHSLSGLFLGQNVPSQGPWTHTGLPNGPESGTPILEFNVFRPIQDESANVYRANIACRVWNVDADVTVRNNVFEGAVRNLEVEANASAVAAGTVAITDNLFCCKVGATQLQTVGFFVLDGTTAVVTADGNTFAFATDANWDHFADGAVGTPSVTETNSTVVTESGANIGLRTNAAALDPDLSLATNILLPVTYASVVVADGAVAYWRLPGVTDEVGALDGTVTGTIAEATSLLTDGDGAGNMTNGSFSVADDAALDSAAFSVEVWVKRSNSVNYGTAVLKSGPSWDSGFGMTWLIGTEVSFNPRLRWWVENYNTVAGAHIDIVLNAGETHHIVGTYDGTNLRLYNNGVEVAGSPVAFAGPVTTNTDDLQVGTGTGGANWPGLIDEPAFYDFALTSAQVADHYSRGTT